jgi:hypothetical protein
MAYNGMAMARRGYRSEVGHDPPVLEAVKEASLAMGIPLPAELK